MLFLIEYDRNQGRIIALTSFPGSDKEKVEELRLGLELNLNLRGIENEVVILEATTEDALRRTHRRYFEDLAELATVHGD